MKKITAYNSSGDSVLCFNQGEINKEIYVEDLEGNLPRIQFFSPKYVADTCFEFQDTVSYSGNRIKIKIPNEMMQFNGKLHLFFVYNNTTKYFVELTIHKKE